MVTVPQIIYIAAVAVYAVLFVMFSRFFWWKHLADRDFWRRRPTLSISQIRALAVSKRRPLPRFSVLVPARNEADVIGKTVEHLANLNYPGSDYEIMMVTDEKETIDAQRTRALAIAEVTELLTRGPARSSANTGSEAAVAQTRPLGADARRLLMHLIAGQALREYGAGQRRAGVVVPASLARLPRLKRLALIRDLAAQLTDGHGRITPAQSASVIQRAASGPVGAELRRTSGALLGLAFPVVVAFADLSGDDGSGLMTTMLRQVARASHSITAEIINTLALAIGGRLIRSIGTDAADATALLGRLQAAAVEALPTTQDILEAWIADNRERPGLAVVKHIVVPYDFDGVYQGRRTGESVPSTKGRALNYALSFVDEATEVCGFYDAESRPDLNTLLYVAWRRLNAPQESRVLQGPVFQVRNMFSMGPFCKIAALYQAVAHEWYLPQIFHRLPFVGGTNLYIEKALLYRLGGYDNSILTEDLELGVRAYMEEGAWPEYLPCPSSEQTPPTVRGFFRQRLRWGTGHLQVMDKLRSDTTSNPERRRSMLHHLFIKGQLEWTVYQAATLVPPTVLILYALGWVDPNILPITVRYLLNVLTLVYFGFTFYVYRRYRPFMDMSSRPPGRFGELGVVSQLLLLPLAAFLFPIPYSTALVLKSLGREPRIWVKTPRTAE